MADRIQVIEALIQSLKQDMAHHESRQVTHKPFTVRVFNLGTDIHLDREEIYAGANGVGESNGVRTKVTL